MKTKRQEFLNVLNVAICGAHKNEVLEQSHCFIFSKHSITTFNGEIIAVVKFENDLGDFAVPAHDLIQLTSKFPDEEIELTNKANQLVMSGNKKRAGLTTQADVLLPIEDIPVPRKMEKIKPGVMEALTMASKICSIQNEDYKVSHVQLSPNKIQATDKFRFLRITLDTGQKSILIPAGALLAVHGLEITSIAQNKSWLFIGNKGVRLGICCTDETYYDDITIDNVLRIEGASPIQLPKEMSNAIDRALIMADDVTKISKIKLNNKSITIRTQKESGWYEERQPVKYKGGDMELLIGLSLFKDLLNKTHKAFVTQEKMKMEKDGIEFVVALGE